jgi:hypothetical protein
MKGWINSLLAVARGQKSTFDLTALAIWRQNAVTGGQVGWHTSKGDVTRHCRADL